MVNSRVTPHSGHHFEVFFKVAQVSLPVWLRSSIDCLVLAAVTQSMSQKYEVTLGQPCILHLPWCHLYQILTLKCVHFLLAYYRVLPLTTSIDVVMMAALEANDGFCDPTRARPLFFPMINLIACNLSFSFLQPVVVFGQSEMPWYWDTFDYLDMIMTFWITYWHCVD